MVRSQLGPRNKLHLICCAGRRHALATFDRIVIGQRNRSQAVGARTRGQFLRRKRAIRKSGVEMEVSGFQQKLQWAESG